MREPVVKLIFGSRLYGTSTDASDTDYKGVYLPSIEECLLVEAKKSLNLSNKVSSTVKNSSEDTDYEVYSLQHFLLDLGKNGDTTFLDMIHAPDSAIMEDSAIWQSLRKYRKKFYTKNLKSYIGYCRSQASKYGIRGSKLEEAQRLLEVLKSYPDDTKLAQLWDELPESEYSKKYEVDKCQAEDKRCFDFCGKKFMATTNVYFATQSAQQFYDSYGERARLAQLNQGIDWKAISHSLRVGLQLKELYSTGDIHFPLKDAEYLRDVKLGKYHYVDDKIAEQLECLITEVEELSKQSSFPEKVDMNFVREFIINCY